jgi:hypothetical protein
MKQNTVETVDQKEYDRLTQELGVASVPIHIWDSGNDYMFADNRFKIWSYVPKPKELRYKRPGVAVPAKQAPQANANGGMLRAPIV